MTSRRLGLIVDFGGVLTTSLTQSIRDCATGYGLPDETFLDLISREPGRTELATLEVGGMTQEEFAARLAGRAGISSDRLLERLCAGLKPDLAMLRAVRAIRLAGVKVAVLSNSWGTGAFDPYAGYSLANLADTVFYSAEEGIRKPDPKAYIRVLDAIGMAPGNTVFVDDVQVNLVPATALGMATIHHRSGPQTVPHLQRCFPQARMRGGRVGVDGEQRLAVIFLRASWHKPDRSPSSMIS